MNNNKENIMSNHPLTDERIEELFESHTPYGFWDELDHAEQEDALALARAAYDLGRESAQGASDGDPHEAFSGYLMRHLFVETDERRHAFFAGYLAASLIRDEPTDDGWEPLTDLGSVRKGDELERTHTIRGGLTIVASGIADCRNGDGDWFTADGTLLAWEWQNSQMYRIRRAPRQEYEPGTWHDVADGVYEGQRAYVNGHRELMIFTSHGGYDVFSDPDAWPTLTPAVVRPKESPDD